MQNILFKTFTKEIGDKPDEFKVGDILYIKTEYSRIITWVISVSEVNSYGWKFFTKHRECAVIWKHSFHVSVTSQEGLIVVGEQYINFGNTFLETFQEKYPEYFI